MCSQGWPEQELSAEKDVVLVRRGPDCDNVQVIGRADISSFARECCRACRLWADADCE